MHINNKKGAVESDSGVTMIVAVLVLAVIALLVFGGFSWIKSSAKAVPGNLAVLATYCENSPYSSNPSAYCGTDYKETTLKGKKAYYTCYDIAQQISPTPTWNKLDCTIEGRNILQSAQKKCEVVYNSGELAESDNLIYISGYECKYAPAKTTSDGPSSAESLTLKNSNYNFETKVWA